MKVTRMFSSCKAHENLEVKQFGNINFNFLFNFYFDRKYGTNQVNKRLKRTCIE